MRLEVDSIQVAYRDVTVVRSAGFRLEEGRLGCLLGPSGCGKTTLLRAIAGFEPVVAGRITLGSEVVSRPGHSLAPERRGIGMVFQDFALFPHLSVAKNLAFGLRGWSRAERAARIDQLLRLIGLDRYGDVYPHQLSGGQQQRVALGRALAPRPGLLLLDEPFSGLDVDLREGLAREVRAILQQEGTTALMVTHDQFEAFAWADEIGVMEAGRIAQWDSGYNLYHRPIDRFVADFVGQGALLAGTVRDGRAVETELGLIEGEVPADCAPGCPVEVLVRPDDVLLAESGISAEVVDRAFRGAEFLYTLRLPSGARLLCLAPSHRWFDVGQTVRVRPDVDHVVMFPRGPDAAAGQ
jgi:iron(III) transport system ATP-binding protein